VDTGETLTLTLTLTLTGGESFPVFVGPPPQAVCMLTARSIEANSTARRLDIWASRDLLFEIPVPERADIGAKRLGAQSCANTL
jgi:hypothetical protein